MSGLSSRWSFLNWFRSSSNGKHSDVDAVDQALSDELGAGVRADVGAEVDDETVMGAELALREDAPREQAIEQLQGAYQEVVGLMHSLQDHMDAQSSRSERLLQMMDGLPDALKSLPAAQQNQTRMLEAIQGHMAQQAQHTEGLTTAIRGLTQTSENHERSMTIIQQQLESNQQSSQHLLNSFNSLSQTLDRMSESNHAGTQLLERLADRADQNESHMRELFTRNQKQVTVLSIVSWSLAIVALAVAGVVALWVGSQVATSDAGEVGPRVVEVVEAEPMAEGHRLQV